jgi:hypothetical protein
MAALLNGHWRIRRVVPIAVAFNGREIVARAGYVRHQGLRGGIDLFRASAKLLGKRPGKKGDEARLSRVIPRLLFRVPG